MSDTHETHDAECLLHSEQYLESLKDYLKGDAKFLGKEIRDHAEFIPALVLEQIELAHNEILSAQKRIEDVFRDITCVTGTAIPRGLFELSCLFAMAGDVAFSTVYYHSGLFGDPVAAMNEYKENSAEVERVAGIRESWTKRLMRDGLSRKDAEEEADEILANLR